MGCGFRHVATNPHPINTPAGSTTTYGPGATPDAGKTVQPATDAQRQELIEKGVQFLEALAHDDEHLGLQFSVPTETEGARSLEDPDTSFTGGRASNSPEANDVARIDVVPDAPQTIAPVSCGASTSFDGLPDIPKFLDRRRSAA